LSGNDQLTFVGALDLQIVAQLRQGGQHGVNGQGDQRHQQGQEGDKLGK